jgi:Ribbon-helix-helix protein, copG family
MSMMSKRLQVLLPEPELAEIQKLAEYEQVSVGEWVRRALRDARLRRASVEPYAKLKSVRQAAECSFPTADIDQMLAEIAQGSTEQGQQG